MCSRCSDDARLAPAGCQNIPAAAQHIRSVRWPRRQLKQRDAADACLQAKRQRGRGLQLLPWLQRSRRHHARCRDVEFQLHRRGRSDSMIRRPVQHARAHWKDAANSRQQLSDGHTATLDIRVNGSGRFRQYAGIGQFGVQCTYPGTGFAVQGDVMLKILGGSGRILSRHQDGTVDFRFPHQLRLGLDPATSRPVSSTSSRPQCMNSCMPSDLHQIKENGWFRDLTPGTAGHGRRSTSS